ncbi:putative aspartyl aminopeptidase [Drosera capensis]
MMDEQRPANSIITPMKNGGGRASARSASAPPIPSLSRPFSSSNSLELHLSLLDRRRNSRAEAKRLLLDAGFHLLSENEEWDLKPGGRYFFTRNMSSLVAFAIGEKYYVGNGFHVIAAHTDSPCLKLKPKSASVKSMSRSMERDCGILGLTGT